MVIRYVLSFFIVLTLSTGLYLSAEQKDWTLIVASMLLGLILTAIIQVYQFANILANKANLRKVTDELLKQVSQNRKGGY